MSMHDPVVLMLLIWLTTGTVGWLLVGYYLEDPWFKPFNYGGFYLLLFVALLIPIASFMVLG